MNVQTNKRKCSPFVISYIANSLKDVSENMNETQVFELSDLGNEIGYFIGKSVAKITDEEISDFIHGLKHGISTSTGTHP